MIHILKNPDYHFVKHRFKAFLISGVAIMIGVVSLISHGGPQYSIDFTGGNWIELGFGRPLVVRTLRAGVKDVGLQNVEVQRFGEEGEIILRTQDIKVEMGEITGFVSDLTAELKGDPFKVMRTESVGPKIGGELKEKALLAIIYSMLGLVIYISWRYEFKFAIAAIVALIHDVLITLGVFSIANRDISLAVVAAFLTIIGYSLNDTIVVFDRIRENLQIRRKMQYEKTLNVSINETLSRTIITSLSTLIVVLSLYIYGSEVIRDFALALIVGVVVGTYSSIYVASPILVEWKKRFTK